MQRLTRHTGIIMSDDLARSSKEEIEAVNKTASGCLNR
jgi:hypothetical protein